METQKEFADKENLTIPLLSDVDRKIHMAFQVGAEGGFKRRVSFLIDRYGILRHIDDGVRVDAHGEDLVKAAGALPSEIVEGKVAPDFVLPDQNGKSIRLSEFRGKSAVALCFFPKALTSG